MQLFLVEDPGVLTFRPGGPAFARISDGGAEVEIPTGKASHVFVRLNQQGWNLAGHLEAASFSLRPMKVVLHDGFLMTTELTNLYLVEADGTGLRLTVRPPPLVKRADPPTPVNYTCDEISLGAPAPLSAEDMLPGDLASRRKAHLRPGEVPLSLEPGSQPVASLIDPGDERKIVELGKQGAYTRIAITNYTTLVFGWVPKTSVRYPPPVRSGTFQGGALGGLSGGGGLGLARGGNDEPTKSGVFSCPIALPLRARAGGELMQVGHIDAGTPFAASPHDGEVHVVEPPEQLKLQGASLEVSSALIARCTPQSK